MCSPRCMSRCTRQVPEASRRGVVIPLPPRPGIGSRALLGGLPLKERIVGEYKFVAVIGRAAPPDDMHMDVLRNGGIRITRGPDRLEGVAPLGVGINTSAFAMGGAGPEAL